MSDGSTDVTSVERAHGMIMLRCRCMLGFNPEQETTPITRVLDQTFTCRTHGDGQAVLTIDMMRHGDFLILPAA